MMKTTLSKEKQSLNKNNDIKRLEEIIIRLIQGNQLNPSLYYAASFLKDTIIQSLEDNDVLKTKVSDEKTDKYSVYIPFIGWSGEDYLIIETLKGTKDIVNVTLENKALGSSNLKRRLVKNNI